MDNQNQNKNKNNPPDFEALRKERNTKTHEALLKMAEKQGWNWDKMSHNFNDNSCYCACADGGPCEHNFQGWREFPEGNGGETFCQRCGMGAMSHSMHVGM